MKAPTSTVQRLLAFLILGLFCLTNAAVLNPTDKPLAIRAVAPGLKSVTAAGKRVLEVDSPNGVPGLPIRAGDAYSWYSTYHLASIDGGKSWKIVGQVSQMGARPLSVAWGAVAVNSNSNGILSAHLSATFKVTLSLGYSVSASLGWTEQFSLADNTLGPNSTQSLQVTVNPPAGKGSARPLSGYNWHFNGIGGV